MDVVTPAVEVIKAIAALLKPVAWPFAILATVCVLRAELRGLVKRISKFSIGHKETTAVVELKEELDTAAKAVPLDKAQLQSAISSTAEGKATITATAEVTNPQKQAAITLRRLMGNDLKSLETIGVKVTEKLPRAAIKLSWEILKKAIIETANLYGFSEAGGSGLIQALTYLSLDALKSEEFLIGVCALSAALDKVQTNQNADVSVKEARDFVLSCMAIIAANLIPVVDKILA